MEDLGGSWGLSELAKSRFIGLVGVWEAHESRSVVPVGVWRLLGMLRSHDRSCLSVSGRLTSHDQSCLSVSGSLPDCSEVMIHRSCWCLEASQGAPAWLLDVFWSSTSSSWRILEALGCSRSLQNQDPSALSVSQKLPGSPSKLPKSRSIGPVGVWEAHTVDRIN